MNKVTVICFITLCRFAVDTLPPDAIFRRFDIFRYDAAMMPPLDGTADRRRSKSAKSAD